MYVTKVPASKPVKKNDVIRGVPNIIIHVFICLSGDSNQVTYVLFDPLYGANTPVT